MQIMKINFPVTLLLGVVIVSAVAGKTTNPPDFDQLDIQLRAAITNIAASDDVLLQSISRLGRVTEPASFWAQIADDSSYSIQHRTRAVFALFRRHGEWCGDARSLGACLRPAKWLDQSSVERITYVFGWLPVEVRPGESVYQISVFRGPSVFIRLQGDVDLETLTAFLRGRDTRALKTNPTILECAYGDDYDKWLRGAAVDGKTRPAR